MFTAVHFLPIEQVIKFYYRGHQCLKVLETHTWIERLRKPLNSVSYRMNICLNAFPLRKWSQFYPNLKRQHYPRVGASLAGRALNSIGAKTTVCYFLSFISQRSQKHSHHKSEQNSTQSSKFLKNKNTWCLSCICLEGVSMTSFSHLVQRKETVDSEASTSAANSQAMSMFLLTLLSRTNVTLRMKTLCLVLLWGTDMCL